VTPIDAIKSGQPLPVGVHLLTEPIVLRERNATLVGSGFGTELKAAGDFPCVIVQAQDCLLSGFTTNGGLHGIVVEEAHLRANNVQTKNSVSHGVMVQGGAWCLYWQACRFYYSGGDGYNSVSLNAGSQSRGNNTSFTACQFFKNQGCGLVWAAAQLSLMGSMFEQNGSDGLRITSEHYSPKGIAIVGDYFESNNGPQIHLIGKRGCAITGVEISASAMYSNKPGKSMVLAEGDSNTIRKLFVYRSNSIASATTEYLVYCDDSTRRSVVEAEPPYERWVMEAESSHVVQI